MLTVLQYMQLCHCNINKIKTILKIFIKSLKKIFLPMINLWCTTRDTCKHLTYDYRKNWAISELKMKGLGEFTHHHAPLHCISYQLCLLIQPSLFLELSQKFKDLVLGTVHFLLQTLHGDFSALFVNGHFNFTLLRDIIQQVKLWKKKKSWIIWSSIFISRMYK